MSPRFPANVRLLALLCGFGMIISGTAAGMKALTLETDVPTYPREADVRNDSPRLLNDRLVLAILATGSMAGGCALTAGAVAAGRIVGQSLKAETRF